MMTEKSDALSSTGAMHDRHLVLPIINSIAILVIAFCLFFLSGFWIGLPEKREELIRDHFISFTLYRILFDLAAVVLALLVLLPLYRLSNRLFRLGHSSRYVYRMLIADFLILSVLSVVYVLRWVLR